MIFYYFFFYESVFVTVSALLDTHTPKPGAKYSSCKYDLFLKLVSRRLCCIKDVWCFVNVTADRSCAGTTRYRKDVGTDCLSNTWASQGTPQIGPFNCSWQLLRQLVHIVMVILGTSGVNLSTLEKIWDTLWNLATLALSCVKCE